MLLCMNLFTAGKQKVLFFSRGRGRGHAVPDAAIARDLEALRPDVEVRLVSYGTGAQTLSELAVPHIDLELPDFGPVAEITALAGKLVSWLQPDLIVSHEEFPALPVAKIFSKSTVLLTDWFADPDIYPMRALKFADRILFLGAEGVFDEPPAAAGRTRYLGAILRDFHYTLADRQRARQELGIPAGALVISVFPGSWREADTPILDVTVEAFDRIASDNKSLLWVAGQDTELVRHKLGTRPAQVFEHYWDIDRLMVATDVAITKTNRKTVFELTHLGVPSVAISFELNEPDDIAVSALGHVRRLAGRDIRPEALTDAICRSLGQPVPADVLPVCSIRRCVLALAESLRSES